MPGGRSQHHGLSHQHRLLDRADRFSRDTHFNTEECRALLFIFDKLITDSSLDRVRMRELLHTCFDITDDVMLDLLFKAFDRDNDGEVSDEEWVRGLSVMIRGDVEQMAEHCYYVYDMNCDRSLAREELSHCLKGCIETGYSVDADGIEECEQEIVEIWMRKLDVDRDGQITYPDFLNAVMEDPLMLQFIGPCLPPAKSIAAFLALITEKFRRYVEPYGRDFIKSKKQKKKSRQSRHTFHTLTAPLNATNISAASEETLALLSKWSSQKVNKGVLIN